jgi:4'-phosphopantetheinyl transferase
MSRGSINELNAVSIAETRSLKSGIVDLWYYFYENAEPSLRVAQQCLLSPDERERQEQLKFERDRRQFLATRSLLRLVLSSYAPVRPVDWRFARTEHGKPRIETPVITPTVHFNVANCRGLVVCVVSLAHSQIGVDVEETDRKVESVEIADRFFAPLEASRIRAFSGHQQQRLFLDLWTLKESYVKACGQGLAAGIGQCAFHVGSDGGIRLETASADDSCSWSFAIVDVPPRHQIAISARTDRVQLSPRATHITPLGCGPD